MINWRSYFRFWRCWGLIGGCFNQCTQSDFCILNEFVITPLIWNCSKCIRINCPSKQTCLKHAHRTLVRSPIPIQWVGELVWLLPDPSDTPGEQYDWVAEGPFLRNVKLDLQSILMALINISINMCGAKSQGHQIQIHVGTINIHVLGWHHRYCYNSYKSLC